jgi:hypothetical protein
MIATDIDKWMTQQSVSLDERLSILTAGQIPDPTKQ